ncbi:CYTH domain-containing protein [Marinobacter salicampi]|uniref:CYTH domain-containing protein n=1 Tax=Marinobacter salicampi TaxID=435907 RepID=UPI001408C08F|nr:CYTH domain-containing protein [Marinobacter salicampi]
MAQELEIKLTVVPAGLEQAYGWFENQSCANSGEARELVNQYYDTPKAELNRQRAALRVRDTGDGFIQTLKTQGDFSNGAHRRQEWEWPLLGRDLNIGLLADTPLGEGVNLAELEPVFETNFRRRTLMLDDGRASIECAFDAGVIRASDTDWPLHEIELELKGGDEASLLYWASKLAQDVPVFLNLISKAEQGYYRAGLHRPQLAADKAPLERFLKSLSLLWLKEEGVADVLDALAAVEPLAKSANCAVELAWLRQRLEDQPKGIFEDRRLGQFQLLLVDQNEAG